MCTESEDEGRDKNLDKHGEIGIGRLLVGGALTGMCLLLLEEGNLYVSCRSIQARLLSTERQNLGSICSTFDDSIGQTCQHVKGFT